MLALTNHFEQTGKDVATVKAALRQQPLTTEQAARLLRLTPDYTASFLRFLSVAGVCEEYMGRWIPCAS